MGLQPWAAHALLMVAASCCVWSGALAQLELGSSGRGQPGIQQAAGPAKEAHGSSEPCHSQAQLLALLRDPSVASIHITASIRWDFCSTRHAVP
jgi:hypothetical protein